MEFRVLVGSIAGHIELEDHGVVDDPVYGSRGGHRIGEHLLPLTEHADRGITGILRGLTEQQAQELDSRLVNEVRNLLFAEPGGTGQDLAALNIQRGRDHGIPGYNAVRIAYGMSPANSFDDVSTDPIVQSALRRAYREVDYIDLWAGGLAEDNLSGAMVGETFHAILVDQFRRLRNGDRFWFENDPYFQGSPGLLADLRATTLADIIRRNTSIGDETSDTVLGGLAPVAPPAILLESNVGPIAEGRLSILEGETGALARCQVQIAEGASVQWSLAGNDAALFQIDEEGILSLNTVPDFEAPASAAGTNFYSITVVATDDFRRPVSQERPITVKVTNVNERPTTSSISVLELTTRDSISGLDLNEFFTDPDGDVLTYTLADDIESGVASASINEGTLSIEPLAGGMVSFLVTATDEGQPPLTQQMTMIVTVTDVNEQPVGNPVAFIELVADNFATSLDLSNFITDPDGDSLIYALADDISSDVVTAIVEEETLFVVPLEEGTVSFQVVATDPSGLTSTITIETTVNGPTPLEPAPAPAPTPATIPEPIPTLTAALAPKTVPTPKPAPTLIPTPEPTPLATSLETIAPTRETTRVPVSLATPIAEPTSKASPEPNLASAADRTLEADSSPSSELVGIRRWLFAFSIACFLLVLLGVAAYAYRRLR